MFRLVSMLLSKSSQTFLGYSNPINVTFDDVNEYFLGCPDWNIGWKNYNKKTAAGNSLSWKQRLMLSNIYFSFRAGEESYRSIFFERNCFAMILKGGERPGLHSNEYTQMLISAFVFKMKQNIFWIIWSRQYYFQIEKKNWGDRADISAKTKY